MPPLTTLSMQSGSESLIRPLPMEEPADSFQVVNSVSSNKLQNSLSRQQVEDDNTDDSNIVRTTSESSESTSESPETADAAHSYEMPDGTKERHRKSFYKKLNRKGSILGIFRSSSKSLPMSKDSLADFAAAAIVNDGNGIAFGNSVDQSSRSVPVTSWSSDNNASATGPEHTVTFLARSASTGKIDEVEKPKTKASKKKRAKSLPKQISTFTGGESTERKKSWNTPQSLEGRLGYKKGSSSLFSGSWKNGYVVLSFANGGSISCYKQKPEADSQEQPRLRIPFTVNWMGKDIEHQSSTFLVEIRGDTDLQRLAEATPDGALTDASTSAAIDDSMGSKTMQEDMEKAKEKGKPLRIFFKCSGGSKEKLLWLAAFTRMGRLSKELYRKKGLIANLQPNIQLSHSRIRSSTCQALALESRILNREDSFGDCHPNLKNSNKEYLVYPIYAYPNQWMTERELRKEMLKPTDTFHDLRIPEAAQKQIGTLKVEVLECIGLPRLDIGSETDAVVYLVCGPYSFVTDVIWNRLNPIWLPKARRACIFPLYHAYARLFTGVFDDDGKNEKDDFAGRVVVDLARCRPRSTYDVIMPLRLSSHVYTRRPRGAVRLRFTVEWKSERDALLSYIPRSFRPPTLDRPADDVTVLCADEKAFRNIAFTVHGVHMPGRFSFQQWRATLREVNLIRKASLLTLRQMIIDMIQWRYPAMSLFVFSVWMRCIYARSVALVPAYASCSLALLMFRNYVVFGTDGPLQNGFVPPSWEEMFRALAQGGEASAIAPLEMNTKVCSRAKAVEASDAGEKATKTTRRKKVLQWFGLCKDENSARPEDYQMEFPFSRGLHYPKFTVKECLVKSTKKGDKASDVDGDCADEKTEKHHNGKERSSRRSYDTDNLDDHEKISLNKIMIELGKKEVEKRLGSIKQNAGSKKQGNEMVPKIPKWKIMPEQDIDVEVSKKKKLSDDLTEVRDNMHRLTFHMFNDRTHLIRNPNACYFGKANKTDMWRQKDVSQELDRLLNVGQYSSANPVVARVGMYVEPIISATHSGICLARALYNIITWRDPFLSFWISLLLISATLVLFIFPWRWFFFALGVVVVGPQNYALRVLEEQGRYPEHLKLKALMGRFKKRKGTDVANQSQEIAEHEEVRKDQPIMTSHTSCGSPPPKLTHDMVDPREIHEVSVPYSQVMYQRFYDWPPEAQYATVEINNGHTREAPGEGIMRVSTHNNQNVARASNQPSNIKKRERRNSLF